MLDKFNNLPVHPLIVHAAVVLTPLAALAAVAFAIVPRWRYVLRWPTVVASVAAFSTLFLARESGFPFKKRFTGATGVLAQRIQTHQHRASILFWLALVFVVLAVVVIWLLAFRRSTLPPAAQWGLSALLVVSAISVLVLVILTGEAGSRAAWGT